jgi:hypothetical protein
MDADVNLQTAGPAPLTLNRRAKEIVDEFLFDGEILLWCDRPQARWSQFIRSLIPSTVGIIVIFGAVLTTFLSQLKLGSYRSDHVLPDYLVADEGNGAIFLIILVSGVLAVTLLLWGRSIFLSVGGNRLVNIFYSSTTFYAVTNRRLIILVGKKATLGLSINLKFLENLRLKEESDGFGSINFEPWLPHANPFKAEDLPPLMFRNISNVSQVFKLIAETQNEALRSGSGA